MAGTKNDPSRMGITLQGYHQVIALSQANINQSLKYHFTINNSKLCDFKAELQTKTGKVFSYLKGRIAPPTIELIDSDKGDHALYRLEFKSGAEFMWMAVDPDDPFTNKLRTVSAEGWKIAFFVDFSMKKAAQLPEDVQKVVNKAGSYSVDQLVVVFGTSYLLNFDWEKSTFPSLEGDKQALLEVRAGLDKVLKMWLESLKSADPGETHNILGYALKVDVPGSTSHKQLLEKIGDPKIPPSFTPAAVQFQTIGNRQQAGSTANSDDDYNAFLFTEMCYTQTPEEVAKGIVRPPQFPQHDLQWSGNWFYDSIGGSMAMSSEIFMKEFVGRLTRPLHEEATAFAEPLAKRQTWDADARVRDMKPSRDFLPPWTHADEWVKTKDNQWKFESTLQANHNNLTWWETGKETLYNIQVNVNSRMSTWLVAIPGTGQFEIRQRIITVTKWVNHANTYVFDATSIFHWKYKVQLTAVSSDAELTAKVDYEKGEQDLTSTITGHGKVLHGAGSDDPPDEKTKWDRYQDLLKNTIVNKMTDTSPFEKRLQDGLNGQKRFVFPGGGTFDMKDPIFTVAGDLMLGLTYREGKSKSQQSGNQQVQTS